MAYTCQGFASKSIGRNGREILKSSNLGCSVALAKECQVISLPIQSARLFPRRVVWNDTTYLNAATVVRDLKRLQSALLDENFQGSRTRIHGVLD